jgi:hypothetical protein
MLLNDLYDHYGTWTQLVRQLNLGNSTYQVWRKQGYIPFKAQLLIENMTHGLFKANEAHGKPALKMEGRSISTQ